MKAKNKNSIGIASLILFFVGLIIIGLGFLLKHLDSAEFSGFFVVFAIWISIVPFLLSGAFAVYNISLYYSKKRPVKCNGFFLISSWFIVVAIGLPFVCLLIYNAASFLFALIP